MGQKRARAVFKVFIPNCRLPGGGDNHRQKEYERIQAEWVVHEECNNDLVKRVWAEISVGKSAVSVMKMLDIPMSPRTTSLHVYYVLGGKYDNNRVVRARWGKFMWDQLLAWWKLQGLVPRRDIMWLPISEYPPRALTEIGVLAVQELRLMKSEAGYVALSTRSAQPEKWWNLQFHEGGARRLDSCQCQ